MSPRRNSVTILQRAYRYCWRREEYELPHGWKAECRIAGTFLYRIANGETVAIDDCIAEFELTRYAGKIRQAKQDRLDYLASGSFYPAESYVPRKRPASVRVGDGLPLQLHLFPGLQRRTGN